VFLLLLNLHLCILMTYQAVFVILMDNKNNI
jgi:hypothetical protein